MRIRVAIVLQLVFALVSISAHATFDWENAAPDNMTVLDDSLSTFTSSGPGGRVMFIFVVFPGDEPPGPYPVPSDADSISIGLTNYLRNQSGGVYDYDPYVVTNPDRNDGWWVADFPAATYNNDTTVTRRYEASWTGDFRYLGELQAEILLKINAAFAGLPNPFTDVVLIEFIYLGDAIETGSSGTGGYGYNSVDRWSEQLLFLRAMRTDFEHFKCVPGCQLEDGSQPNLDLRWIVSHETGHTLGLGTTYTHSPSRGCEQISREGRTLNPESQYYGPYSNMRVVAILGKGPMPYHPVDLIKKGWLTVTTITDFENHENVVLGDVRLSKNVLRIPRRGVPSQYLLLAYHGGNGMDVIVGADGLPIYPSRGLAIWHITSGTWDLESASGRFADPGTPTEGTGFWNAADAVNGYDNLDVWAHLCDEIPDPPELIDYWYDYFYNYPGSSDDFFGAMSGAHEFSFRSNPSTLWQVDELSRRAPQNVPNPFVIRVVEEHGDYAVLDILCTPTEHILTPAAGSVLQRGQPCEISWTSDFGGGLPGSIRWVDIFYSAGPGVSDVQIANSVLATNGHFTWTPGPRAELSTTGKFKLVCRYLDYAAATGTSESDGFVTMVDVPAAKFTDVSAQTGLDYPGTPYSGTILDLDVDEHKDLLISESDESSFIFRGLRVSSSGAPEFYRYFEMPAVGVRGVALADYDNDGDEDIFLAHETTPKLYRNDGGIFVDVTVAMGLTILAANSTAACWGDYDNDGWLDLYVVRSDRGYSEPPDYLNISGDSHRLFRSQVRNGGGFVDVSTAAGIAGYAATGSVSASWGDLENDGDLDLVVVNLQEQPTGPPGGIGNHLFVNQGNGTFTEEFLDRFPGQIFYATAAQWADMDNDGDLDLVASCATPGSAIYCNDGTGHFATADKVEFSPDPATAYGTGYNGVQIFDQDLDGWQDVLLVSRKTDKPSRFFSGVPTATGVAFVDNTANVNLSSTSKAMGSIAADFTNDGDLDLFVGRPIASGQYFYKTDSLAGANSLGRNYVKLRLASPFNANNRQGIGAQVTVTAGDLTQLQAVDGGSGRGGQKDRDLVFGLGSYAGPVTASVKWPGGYVQSGVSLVVSNGSATEAINTISDVTPPVISNVAVATLIVPGTSNFDWVFSWDTNVGCDPSLDVLTIDQSGISNPCWPGWTVVTPSTSGVEQTYAAKAGGGYTHKFTIYGRECNLNCSFRYTVSSGTGPNQVTSATKTKKVTFCASGS